MITKASLLSTARVESLQLTTVEKDYVLGWILYGVSENEIASRWVFKGGTCLKKCFFNTYRFSEDLDFTIPSGLPYASEAISDTLWKVTEWVESESGVSFPDDGFEIDEYKNLRGNKSFQVKLSFSGPLQMPRRSLQRVKFDLTNDEVIADNPLPRLINHPYDDQILPTPEVLCYSINEVLAEKSRALYERRGRARDVYDVVHVSRAFRDFVDPTIARNTLEEKFAFKGLPNPTVNLIIERIDVDLVRTNWNSQLAHQLPVLPDFDQFLDALRGALSWWMEPQIVLAEPTVIPGGTRERTALRIAFAHATDTRRFGIGSQPLSKITYAARNRLCLRLRYKGIERIVEPYSIRYPTTGNTLLYVWERIRGGVRTQQIKAFNISRIQNVEITKEPYIARYVVEL